MTTRAIFYAQRDLRSQQFGLDEDLFEKPVRVAVGRQCLLSPAGQSAALALINMAARLHRSIDLSIPAGPLQVDPLAGGKTFEDAVTRLAHAIDPFLRLGGSGRGSGISLGIGADAPPGLTWYVGGVGGAAILARDPVPLEPAPAPTLDASFAACLGAMALCRELIGDPLLHPIAIDVWDWTVAGAFTRPAPAGPVDVGDVLTVGAGGVGSCFAYWVREFGHRGRWSTADGDTAELHNTNRCLGMFAREAGWPRPPGKNKAEIAAAVMGAKPLPRFYDELSEEEARADLVLPLANHREIRHLVGQRGDPVILHATTSPAWEAQLHRHIPDLDDCICCRMPQSGTTPQFKCSTAPAPTATGQSADAALPFLSAAAGLILVRGLLLLQHGQLRSIKSNLYALRMRDARGPTGVSRFRCREACAGALTAATRAIVQRGHRWAAVDEAASRHSELLGSMPRG